MVAEITTPFFILLGVVIMCAMAFAIILFVLIYQKRYIRQQIEYDKKLQKAALQAQEDERRRIASELHDGLAPMLAAIKMKLYQFGRNYPTAENSITEAKNMLSETIDSVRVISHNLLPPVIDRAALGEALGDLCERFNNAEAVEIRYSAQQVNGSLPDAFTKLSVYRIAQELIMNAMKHGHPTWIEVKLVMGHNNLQLIVKDNGKGFVWDKQDTSFSNKGIGLLNIHSRVRLLNGNIYQEPSITQGCCFVVELPLN